ncbi:MAG: hypothetical protein MUF15_09570, partial [Acidobacteria bacterium]|nr:hypothetical protein [Acidobacteriota bacterium]
VGDYGESLNLFKVFIEKNRGNKALKNQLIEAYYYEAKIYFLGDLFGDMEEALKNLFKLNIKYSFSEENSADFLRRAYAIQKVLEEEELARKQIEKERAAYKNKKKFPWVIVVGTVVAVGAAIFLLTKKPKENTLSVSIGDGVDGNPVSGNHSYRKSSTVSYNYTLKNGYINLVVKLDGADAAASGTIKMDRSHTLTANAAKNFTLTVTRGEGVNGSPDTGTFFYTDGQTVTYNYSLQNGYVDLMVTLDGLTVPAGGSILMNQSHILNISAGKTYTIEVTKGNGIIGIPDTGSYTYKDGYFVNYGYTLQSGYSNLVVLLDGVQVVPTGTIKMDKNHILITSANKTITFFVIKDCGVHYQN